MTKKEKRNIRQEVTDKIVDALESGTAPYIPPSDDPYRPTPSIDGLCIAEVLYRDLQALHAKTVIANQESN